MIRVRRIPLNSVKGRRLLSSASATEAKAKSAGAGVVGKGVTAAANAASTSTTKHSPFSKAQLAFLERLIRVDQAGELGADYIYHGQYLALSDRRPDLKPILKHMWEQEIHHHNTFDNLQATRRVRPSLITPLWKFGAMAMGIGTGLMGKEAAMACTEAVETVIGGHYNEQLRVLMNQMQVQTPEGNSMVTSDEIKELQKLVSQFRDEELEHLDTAVENDAHGARPYWLLTEAIKVVCKGAIWTAERV